MKMCLSFFKNIDNHNKRYVSKYGNYEDGKSVIIWLIGPNGIKRDYHAIMGKPKNKSIYALDTSFFDIECIIFLSQKDYNNEEYILDVTNKNKPKEYKIVETYSKFRIMELVCTDVATNYDNKIDTECQNNINLE